jgi:hypothetical protein
MRTQHLYLPTPDSRLLLLLLLLLPLLLLLLLWLPLCATARQWTRMHAAQ